MCNMGDETNREQLEEQGKESSGLSNQSGFMLDIK